MTIHKIDIRHFVFLNFESGERARLACWFRRLAETNFKSAKANDFCPHGPCHLFLNPRNMSGGKLPTTIAPDQRVRELHDSVE
jgi:hypothetical protein